MENWRRKMKTEWLSFWKVRAFAKRLKLKNKTEWEKFISGKSNKIMIPVNPGAAIPYRSKWACWGDFLGTGNKKGWCTKRKYKVNDNYFKKWSHDMAYIFGLWFADGHITKIKQRNSDYSYIFCINLYKDDKYLLED